MLVKFFFSLVSLSGNPWVFGLGWREGDGG